MRDTGYLGHDGKFVLVPEMVPELMVPDLTGFKVISRLFLSTDIFDFYNCFSLNRMFLIELQMLYKQSLPAKICLMWYMRRKFPRISRKVNWMKMVIRKNRQSKRK